MANKKPNFDKLQQEYNRIQAGFHDAQKKLNITLEAFGKSVDPELLAMGFANIAEFLDAFKEAAKKHLHSLQQATQRLGGFQKTINALNKDIIQSLPESEKEYEKLSIALEEERKAFKETYGSYSEHGKNIQTELEKIIAGAKKAETFKETRSFLQQNEILNKIIKDNFADTLERANLISQIEKQNAVLQKDLEKKSNIFSRTKQILGKNKINIASFVSIATTNNPVAMWLTEAALGFGERNRQQKKALEEYKTKQLTSLRSSLKGNRSLDDFFLGGLGGRHGKRSVAEASGRTLDLGGTGVEGGVVYRELKEQTFILKDIVSILSRTQRVQEAVKDANINLQESLEQRATEQKMEAGGSRIMGTVGAKTIPGIPGWLKEKPETSETPGGWSKTLDTAVDTAEGIALLKYLSKGKGVAAGAAGAGALVAGKGATRFVPWLLQKFGLGSKLTGAVSPFGGRGTQNLISQGLRVGLPKTIPNASLLSTLGRMGKGALSFGGRLINPALLFGGMGYDFYDEYKTAQAGQKFQGVESNVAQAGGKMALRTALATLGAGGGAILGGGVGALPMAGLGYATGALAEYLEPEGAQVAADWAARKIQAVEDLKPDLLDQWDFVRKGFNRIVGLVNKSALDQNKQIDINIQKRRSEHNKNVRLRGLERKPTIRPPHIPSSPDMIVIPTRMEKIRTLEEEGKMPMVPFTTVDGIKISLAKQGYIINANGDLVYSATGYVAPMDVQYKVKMWLEKKGYVIDEYGEIHYTEEKGTRLYQRANKKRSHKTQKESLAQRRQRRNERRNRVLETVNGQSVTSIPSGGTRKTSHGKATQSTPVPSGGLGSVSASEESSRAGAGAVSPWNDNEGVSYGTYQLSSKRGSVQRFLKAFGYENQFGGLSPGTPEFSRRWQEIAASDPNFAANQQAFAQNEYYGTALSNLQSAGMDLSQRGRAVQEALWSTSIQYGQTGASKLFQKALQGKDITSMSDEDIINSIYDYKFSNIERYFKAPDRAGQYNRIPRERQKLLAMASTEYNNQVGTNATLKQSAASAPAQMTTVNNINQGQNQSTIAHDISRAVPKCVDSFGYVASDMCAVSI